MVTSDVTLNYRYNKNVNLCTFHDNLFKYFWSVNKLYNSGCWYPRYGLLLIFLLYIYDMTFLGTHNVFLIVNKSLTSCWLYGAIMCYPLLFGTKIYLILNPLAWRLGVFCLALPHSFSLLVFPSLCYVSQCLCASQCVCLYLSMCVSLSVCPSPSMCVPQCVCVC